MKLEDATKLLIEFLRNPDHGSFGKYGYEIYLPALLRTYYGKSGDTILIYSGEKAGQVRIESVSAEFFEAQNSNGAEIPQDFM